MPKPLRSATCTEGRRMAGARSLWRANGMKEEQFGKPIVAIANSFTQFVPGHVHLHEIGQRVKSIIEDKGCFAAEFNTIAIDDGIAMGHGGMLYSLPSRELIADSVEYMCNAHRADALVCIPNCDKIVPGMLMAAVRLNIPTIFVSGGPMEAGESEGRKLDLIDVMVMAGDSAVSDQTLDKVERAACPTCGSCSGLFTANSMNCLMEALGFALPGNGTILATHKNRLRLFDKAAAQIVEMAHAWYGNEDRSVLPKSIATREAFINAMVLDIAMGGSTNTVLHLLAIAQAAGVDFTMRDIDLLSRKAPNLCKVAPSASYHVEDVSRAGGVFGILGELDRAGLLDTSVQRVDAPSLAAALDSHDIMRPTACREAVENAHSAPGGKCRIVTIGSQEATYAELDRDRERGCIRDLAHAYSRDGGLAVLYGNLATKGCIVKTAGVDPSIYRFRGSARVYDSQEQACDGILDGEVKAGEIVVIRYEGPKGGPGMQEMLYPTSYLKSMHLDKACALLTDGRFSGGSSGLSVGHVSPEAAAGGAIALIENGDLIEIDIAERRIQALVADSVWEARGAREKSAGALAYKPKNRQRPISEALRAYAIFAASADEGAVRRLPDI